MNPRNLGKSKEETARLSEENKLMEIRLQELKLAMDREKTARNAQNQGHWQSARDDKPLVNHPPEMLKKNMRQYEKPRASRVRKIKVLKDEPLLLPPRPPPITDDIKRIMKKDLAKENAKESSSKTKRCGQCEMKAAAVICQDCGENYCPGCFASFHLKGALKKHRSVPIQALGARQSPRLPFLPKPPPVSYHEKEPAQIEAVEKIEKKQPKVQFEGPSLLEGAYDEQANASEFAAALTAWRSGKGSGDQSPESPDSKSTSSSGSPKSSNGQPKSARPSADQATQSPRHTLDVKGTSTDEGSKPVKIEFHQSELSYADKLLLRKHRRDPVEAMPVPSPRHEQKSVTADMPDTEDLSDRSENVDFQALYQVSCPSPRSVSRHTGVSMTSQVQVVEVSSMTDVSSMEQVTCYQVEEEPGCIEFVNEKNAKNERVSKNIKTKDKSRVEPEVRKSSAKSETSPVKSAGKTQKMERQSSDLRKTWEKEPSMSFDKIPTVDGSRKPPIPKSTKNQKHESKMGMETEEQVSKISTRQSQSEDLKLNLQKEKSVVKSRRTTASPRPKSRNSNTTPRSARPNSRQARALLKETLGEGVLTKKPSSALSAIAQRSSSDYVPAYRGLGDILTLGVQPVQEDRIIVPRSHTPRSARTEKRPQSVSYKLYAMGPKSWRPESALAEVVPTEQLTGHNYNLDLVDLAAENDDDVKKEMEALNVIGRLDSNFSNEKTKPVNQVDHVRLTPRDPIDQSEDLHLSLAFRESVQSDSSDDEALQRLAEEESPRSQPDDDGGRLSQMIVVDGDDMTQYDNDKYMNSEHEVQPELEDASTLDQLEWELASMAGRITAEGKISRLSLHSSQDSAVSSPGSSQTSSQNMDSAREIDIALRNDGLGFDEIENQITDELEVRALQ